MFYHSRPPHKLPILFAITSLALAATPSSHALGREGGDHYSRAVAVSEQLLANGENICDACGYAILDDSQEHLTLQVKGGAEALTGDALRIFEDNSDIIEIVDVEFSLKELTAAYSALVEQVGDNHSIYEMSINPIRQRIDLTLDPSHDNSPLQASPTSTSPENKHTQFTPEVPIKISFSNHPPQPMAGRDDDYSRFYMGGKIVSPKRKCSLGLPVRINWKSGVLTAGHCLEGTFQNGSGKQLVGSTYLTAYDDYQPQDWQILTGSTYANRVFNTGPATSQTDSLAISGVGLKPLAINRQLCASGYRTGQTCRYFVTSTNYRARFHGRVFSSLTRTAHRSYSQNDCAGFRNGDSGGLAYYSDGAGGVIAYGIVTSNSFDEDSTSCGYAFTPLRLVKERRSSIQFLSTDR